MTLEPNEIRILLFAIGDSRYGIDIDQIACLMNSDTRKPAVPFEQLIGISALAEPRTKLLMVKQALQLPIVISEPDEVVTVPVPAIRSLPDVLLAAAGSKGVWGFWPQGRHRPVILLDFYKNKLFMQLTGSANNQGPCHIRGEIE